MDFIISFSRLHNHTQTHHSRYWMSDGSDVENSTSQTQRPLPDNTQHSQETDIHVAGGIRTHNPSKPAAAEPRLRPRGGHWDISCYTLLYTKQSTHYVHNTLSKVRSQFHVTYNYVQPDDGLIWAEIRSCDWMFNNKWFCLTGIYLFLST